MRVWQWLAYCQRYPHGIMRLPARRNRPLWNEARHLRGWWYCSHTRKAENEEYSAGFLLSVQSGTPAQRLCATILWVALSASTNLVYPGLPPKWFQILLSQWSILTIRVPFKVTVWDWCCSWPSSKAAGMNYSTVHNYPSAQSKYSPFQGSGNTKQGRIGRL